MAFMSYTVQSGDNLTNIANEFGISIQSIQNYNSISNPDNIRVGDILKIPSESTHTTNYVIQYGDTLNSIANKFGTTPDRLQSLNNIANPDYIQVGQVLTVDGEAKTNSSNVSEYTVQSGDNLSAIAQKFNTSVSELQSLNNISNPDYIQIGQEILVPGNYDIGNDTDDSEDNGSDNDISSFNGDKVTAQQLIAVGWPSSVVTEAMLNDLNNCLEEYEINTKSRVMHFISQCSAESLAGTYREEIKSGESYEGRTDLGNTQPGDGPKYKGAGYIMITGRANYTRFANSIGDQEIVEQGVSYVAANYPWTSAGFWWYINEMNQLCDTNPSVEQVTFKVNGGYNNLADRKQYYQKCVDAFSNYGESSSSSEKGSAKWLNQYRVTAEYGYYDININNNMHYVMDFGLFTGTPVKAITSGTVLETKWNPGGGGNTITVKENDDQHYQWYMHLSEYNVKPGQTINTGDVIAYSGDSGKTSGPHLHFQRMTGKVSNQAAENPREFLEQLGLNS